MANIAGGGGGRTGPYWRRQLGITLPNERTAGQLRLINALHKRMGQPLEGGPMRAQAGPARRRPMPPMGMPAPMGHHPDEEAGGGMSQIPEQPFDEFPGLAGQQGMPAQINRGPLGRPVQQGQNDLESLRQQLLSRVMGGGVPTSRDALRRYVQQAGMRHAQAGPQRPILPARPPLRRAMNRPF